MSKNNLINTTLDEIKELETLVNGLVDLEQIPALMFRLAENQINNIKNVLGRLAEENQSENKTVQPTAIIDSETNKAFVEKKSCVNEKLSTKINVSFEKSLGSKKIADLKKGISLNDKFRFQRELFNGNADLLHQTLEALNEMSDKNEAFAFLSKYNWNAEHQCVADFMELINRKFSD